MRIPCATWKITRQNPNHASIMFLDFQLLEMCEKTLSVVSKLPNLLYCLMAAWTKTSGHINHWIPVPFWICQICYPFLASYVLLSSLGTLLPLLHLMNNLLFKAHLKCYLFYEVPPKFPVGDICCIDKAPLHGLWFFFFVYMVVSSLILCILAERQILGRTNNYLLHCPCMKICILI